MLTIPNLVIAVAQTVVAARNVNAARTVSVEKSAIAAQIANVKIVSVANNSLTC